MKYYKSKIGLEIFLPLVMITGGLSVFLAFNGDWVGVAVLTSLTLLIYLMFKTTRYIIEDGVLRIRSSFLINQTVEIMDIKRVKETRNAMSAPAGSLDRLEVVSNKSSVLISPLDKKGFIAELKSINPKIKIIYRKK